MLSISRKEQCSYLDEGFLKKAFTGFERVSFGFAKEDPFADKVSGDVWSIKGSKLIRNNKKAIIN